MSKGQPATGKEQKTEGRVVADCSLPVAGFSPVLWCSTGHYLSQRPSFTFDPLFHAGCYYVQEASSMFLEQAFKQLLDLSEPLKVLDLCAAPGGKSTHIQSLLPGDGLLVSNEVIKQRNLVLTDNVVKWGCTNVFVTNNDPKAFQKLPGYFDVLVTDAPCSGSGLFRKDEAAVNEWSPHAVQLCSQRQQRILADALPGLREGGLLIYSTCSYSAEEDEAIADWLVREMGMETLSINIGDFDGIVETRSLQTASAGYRFYPDKIKGEGFFLACFRKQGGEDKNRSRPCRPAVVSSSEKKSIEQWVESAGHEYIRFRDGIFALPQTLLPQFSLLQQTLNLQYGGVRMGEVMKDRLVPDHALAQNGLLKKEISAVELSYTDAVSYLRREALSVVPETNGWAVVRYKGHNLGWINVLKNRVNNYYPKELRILTRQNRADFKK